MTQFKAQDNSSTFTDLRQQIAALVCDTPVTADQVGQLPEGVAQPIRRRTLHLSCKEKNASLKEAA